MNSIDMLQVNRHPLAEFVYRTFGTQCADLLMVGYNKEPSRRRKSFHITEELAGESIEWEIEMDSNSPPSGQEPLVLAALLKLLLQRSAISTPLEFRMDELVEELGWNNNPTTRRTIDRVITSYAALFYHKEPTRRQGKQLREREGISLRWGQYSLLTAYLRGSISGAGGARATRTYRRVDINKGFVEGLKRGRVYFADIDFGELKLEDSS